MRKAFCLAALAGLMLAAGCVNYDERIEINPDGSGVVRMHLAVSEQAIGITGMPKPTTEDELLPSPRPEMVADLERQGFKVKGLRAESAGGMRHFYIVLEFKNLADVEKSEVFKDRHATLTKEGGKFVYRQTVAVSERTLTDRTGGGGGPMMPPPKVIDLNKPPQKRDDAKGEPPKTTPGDAKKDAKKDAKPEEYVSVIKQMEMRFGRERVLQMFAAYSISFSVQMKDATLLKTNGFNHRDAVAIWDTPLEQLVEKWPTISMEASFAPNGPAPVPAPTAPEAKKP